MILFMNYSNNKTIFCLVYDNLCRMVNVMLPAALQDYQKRSPKMASTFYNVPMTHFSSTSLCKNLEFMLTASDDFRLQKSDITKAVLFQLGWMDLIKSWEISSAATQKHFQINSRNLCKHKNYNMLLLCEKILMSRLKSNNNISYLRCVYFDVI